MNRATGFLACMLLLSSVVAVGQQKKAQSIAIPDSMSYVWAMVERDFTALAEAMPEDKWNFKPTEGEFSSVRTFGEQVKHVACGNEAWARKLRGEKLPEHCETGGDNPAKTKAEILAYLRQTFQMMDQEIAATSMKNLLTPAKGHYAGRNRVEILNAALWHASDHYGQLVVYLRMNGLVPPASRRQ